MIDFSAATVVHKKMPKEAFYKHLSLTKSLKDKFVSDVERIYVENSLTQNNLKLTADSDVKEILLLSVALKKQEFDPKIIEAIAKQNPHKLVFHLTFEGRSQLALYHGKLYRAVWIPSEKVMLSAKGYSLAEIWDGLIEQIALYEERAKSSAGQSIDERFASQERIAKLQKQIEQLERKARAEKQPKKKFELHQQILKLKQEEAKRTRVFLIFAMKSYPTICTFLMWRIRAKVLLMD